MKRWLLVKACVKTCVVACVAAAVLAGCASGPPRRVSEPAASIQQLTVGADGSWRVALRVQNYSSVPMRFEGIRLAMTLGDVAAGSLDATPALTIGPEAADIVDVVLQPSADARILMSDVFSARRNITYTLEGTLDAAPADRGSSRSYTFKRDNALSPVPGLPGVLR